MALVPGGPLLICVTDAKHGVLGQRPADDLHTRWQAVTAKARGHGHGRNARQAEGGPMGAAAEELAEHGFFARETGRNREFGRDLRLRRRDENVDLLKQRHDIPPDDLSQPRELYVLRRADQGPRQQAPARGEIEVLRPFH